MAAATKVGKTKTKTTEKGTAARRLVELIALASDEKGQQFTALVAALSAKRFEVSRGSRALGRTGA
jgi:hypothetical protein